MRVEVHVNAIFYYATYFEFLSEFRFKISKEQNNYTWSKLGIVQHQPVGLMILRRKHEQVFVQSGWETNAYSGLWNFKLKKMLPVFCDE